MLKPFENDIIEGMWGIEEEGGIVYEADFSKGDAERLAALHNEIEGLSFEEAATILAKRGTPVDGNKHDYHDTGRVPASDTASIRLDVAVAFIRDFAERTYPESVFSPDSDSLDAKSACFARTLLNHVADELAQGLEEEETI